ncbi:MAG: transcription termination/antitermination protein NusA [Chloroflexi bacterium]|nr:transcription termination/antitermination protein NusA [Chloroflexota bacterium]
MKSDMLLAVMQLSAERNLPQESVVSAFEDAIAAAYRRDPAAEDQDVTVQLDPESGEVIIHTVVHVVDEIDEIDPRGQISVDQASSLSADARAGDDIITGVLEFTPQRIAARTVTQVLMQRLRSAERRLVYEQYADKEGEIISAPVRRVASPRGEDLIATKPTVFVDLGKADATMPGDEQSPNERYRTGMELKLYVTRVSDHTSDGEGAPEIIVSRRHPMLLRRLMELEVPEVKSGLVEIKSIARQAGARSKVAVYSNKHDVDPIGACVGLRGIRIQNIVTELMGEKIDILEWSDDPSVFIANSLGPAQVEEVIVVDEQTAEVIVPENQLSLAIGKEGQNVSLATRLTNFRIDIKGSAAYAEELIERQREREAEAVRQAAEEEATRLAAEAVLADQAAAAKAAAEEEERKRLLEIEEAEAAAATLAEASIVVPDADLVPEPAIEIAGESETQVEEQDEVPRVADQDVEMIAEIADEVFTVEEVEADIAEPAVPSLFVPDVKRPEPEPVIAEEPEEDLDLELLELEEKLKELELEEQERLEAEREAAELESLEQDIDSDELWALPDDLQVAPEAPDSGLRFAEDISGYRDEEGRRGSGRGGRRSGGARRTRR